MLLSFATVLLTAPARAVEAVNTDLLWQQATNAQLLAWAVFYATSALIARSRHALILLLFWSSCAKAHTAAHRRAAQRTASVETSTPAPEQRTSSQQLQAPVFTATAAAPAAEPVAAPQQQPVFAATAAAAERMAAAKQQPAPAAEPVAVPQEQPVFAPTAAAAEPKPATPEQQAPAAEPKQPFIPVFAVAETAPVKALEALSASAPVAEEPFSRPITAAAADSVLQTAARPEQPVQATSAAEAVPVLSSTAESMTQSPADDIAKASAEVRSLLLAAAEANTLLSIGLRGLRVDAVTQAACISVVLALGQLRR